MTHRVNVAVCAVAGCVGPRPLRSQDPTLVRRKGDKTGLLYGHNGRLPVADIEARKRVPYG
eukprot:850977-Prorocentrum_minimum.AAC.1